MLITFSLLENRDSHLAGLIEAKPEVLGKFYSYRKDVHFTFYNFCIHANFLSVQSLRRYEFLKNNACSLIFPLLENRDGHLAGLIEAKPEVLGKMYPYRKECHFTFYNFVFMQIFCRCNR